ncbi:H(2):CoB-CoM heterodisulfide,ferredoxin reductase subunit B [Candidatus Lokiarchaeum ossiferum]|uniref:H(2):CoB-CoM heterodisulfide,ferredoxin reductase subunit B n=1 Tax=Candidatus Lokiarchaeum ossiferum TaxID=2951803 RepID=A0ABY6HV07_9ARCH|nr:H(2):CoB-CoM heterodisulfide,ferredoxin reductase subunit B [Candidatus Lokiarchaeum sp. B-35]
MTTETHDYEFFPGCTIQNRIPFIEKSARLVFDKLGVTLNDNKEFGCCPDPVGVQSTDHQTWLTLGARNLSLAEKNGRPIISMCNGCTETLKAVNYELNHHSHEKSLVQERLEKVGKTYTGIAQVKHFVEVLHDEIGLEAIKSAVEKPLTGFKVAIHVGCHYARPSEMMQIDDPMKPFFAKEILEQLGAEIIEYDEENMCCSSGVARNNEDAANGMMKRKYSSILEAGANIIMVNCPSCFQQLEAGQRSMKKTFGMEVKIPVLYITELMALAFGMPIKDLGLKFHQNKPMKLLKELGF